MNQRNLLLGVTFAVLIAVGAFSIASGRTTLDHVHAHGAVSSCAQRGQNHAVTIRQSRLSSGTTIGHLCDTLTITNQDDTTREIGFGAHEHHEAYDGVAEKVLRQGQSVTVTLNQLGTYHFHDHFHDEVAGSFTVTK